MLAVGTEKYLVKNSAKNISVSASNQQSGKAFMPSFDSVVINNGIDLKKFNPHAAYKNIRQELNIPDNKTTVLFIARFTVQKQPIALIKAFAKAVTQNPLLHLIMIGDGDQKKEAIDLINQTGLKNSISLLPFRQDVPDVLAAADIFVLPSLWEGLPIGLLEAMAMGKAIIASNVDGTIEVIQHNQNGLLIDTNNLIVNLADALLILSADKEMRERFGCEAIKTITSRYNATNMTKAIENIYRNTVNSHTPNS